MAKVSDAFNNIPESPMGYIRLVQFAMGGDATERTLDTLTTRELMDLQQKDVAAYYRIGEYWYVVANS